MLKRLLLLLLCAAPLAAQTINPNQIKPSAQDDQWLHTVTGGVPPIWDTLPSSSAGITPQIVPPIDGQAVDIYPTVVTPVNTSVCGSENADLSSVVIKAGPGGGLCGGEWGADYSGFSLPSYVLPANVTAVYAFATAGYVNSNATQYLNCSDGTHSSGGMLPGGVVNSNGPDFPLLFRSAHTGILGTTIGSVTCQTRLALSTVSGITSTMTVNNIGLRVYYTGTPPPADTRIQIAAPLSLNSVTNTLGFDPLALSYSNTLPLAQLPSASLSTGQVFPVSDGVGSTACTSGWCYSNGTSWVQFVSGGGGGVTSINGTAGAYTFTGSGVGCTGTTCTFSTSPLTGSGTLGYLPLWTPNSTTLGDSNIDDGITTAATLTAHEPIAVTGSTHGITIPAGTAVAGAAGKVVYASDSTNGYAEVNENATGLSRVCTAANGICGTYTNVVASASGDTTVAAINAKCTGGQTYWASIPLSIATGGTIASGCNVMFVKGGVWTIASGQNVTFANPVRENDGPSQHFTGSGTVTFPAQDDWGEWFGSVGDWNGTTGTDNAAAIQKALNALTAGDVLFQSRAYAVGSTLNMNAANIGFKCSVQLSITPWTGSNICVVVNTSASADTLDVNIGGGTTQLNNRIYGMDFQRSVNPTGTAAGISSHNTGGFQVSYTTSEDSIYNFAQDTFDGVQYEYISAQWGFEGLTPPAGNYYGIYSTTNLIINTAFTNADPATGRGSTGTFYGAYQKGVSINDTWIDFLQVNGGTTGWYLEYTGTGTAGQNYDIHLWRPVIDHTFGQSIVIKNVAAAADGSVGINSGAVGSSNLTSGACIDIESSSGIVVKNMSPISCSAGTADSIIANSSSGISIIGNEFSRTAANTGVLLNTTTNSIVSNNLFYEDGASAAGTGVSLVSSTNNAIGQNSFYGKWNVALSLDSASSGNTALDTNTCSTTTVTCLSETIGNNPLVTNEMKFGTGGVIINLGGGYGMTAYNGATTDATATGVEGGVGDPTLYLNALPTGNYAFRTAGTIVATVDDAGNMHPGNGSNIVYRCATAGTLPVGALTITSGDCGTTTDTGLRVK